MPALPVAIDVTPLLGVRTGIGRSVEEVVAALRALPDGPRLLPYALGRPRHRAELPAEARLVPVPTRLLLAAWSRTERPAVDPWVRGAQVLHATAFVAPPTRLPTLVTVHDCAFALHPGTVAATVHAFDPLLRRAVARGAHIHTTTAQVAGEVEELLGIDLRAQGRLSVVPFAVPHLGRSHVGTDAAAPATGPPYVLALGTLEPRKNLPSLVRAFGALADLHPELRLVLAGPDGSGAEAVRAAVAALPTPVRARVALLGVVDAATRVRLLTGAAIVAYPSLYEGFGFPVLEAMTVGTPVVAADLPALREVARDGALFAATGDDSALAGALDRVLGDEAVRDQLVQRGRAVAAGYSWERTARGLAQVYVRLSTASYNAA